MGILKGMIFFMLGMAFLTGGADAYSLYGSSETEGVLLAAEGSTGDAAPDGEESGEEAEGAEPEAAEDEEGEAEANTLVDRLHEKISERVKASSNWIDSFFDDERIRAEETESRLRIDLSALVTAKESVDFEAKPRLRLDLPVFKERLRLLVRDDSEGEPGFRSTRRPRDDMLTRRDEGTTVALRYYLLSTLKQNISISSGIKIRSGIPHPYFEPRYRHTVPIDENWQFRFTQRFRAMTDGTQEAQTTFDIERPFGEDFFFRNTAEGGWFNDEPGYSYVLQSALYQTLSPRRMVEYLWSHSFRTEPTHVLDGILLHVRYRQRIWRDWLFAEITPRVTFAREFDYDINPGINFRLEVIFGAFEELSL